MGTDYAGKERTFIAGLEADTGCGLDAWMRAIDQSGLSERNDIIDWLRQNGFTFSNASWIERIHHNGGRLVYGDGAEPQSLEQRSLEPRLLEIAPGDGPPPLPLLVRAKAVATPVPEIPTAAAPPLGVEPAALDMPVSLRATDAAQIDPAVMTILATAKGLRPLAELVLREIRAAIPGVQYHAEAPLVIISDPLPFAALLPGPKKLLLYASLDSTGALEVRTGALIAKSQPPYPQMLVLDDARRIGQDFRDAVAGAARKANTNL
jgi:hypothetical protein